MSGFSVEDLDVYKRAYKLALDVYNFSSAIPRELQYDIADDLRRAARSVLSNIAEGYGRRKSSKDIISFLKISLGSCDEVLFNLRFLKDLDLINEKKHRYLSEEYVVCCKQLNRLISSFR